MAVQLGNPARCSDQNALRTPVHPDLGAAPRSGRGAVARGGDTAMKTKSHGAAFAIPWPRSCGRAVLAMCRWLALPIWRARSRRQGRVTPSHPKNLPDVFRANDVPAMSDKLTMLSARYDRGPILCDGRRGCARPAQG